MHSTKILNFPWLVTEEPSDFLSLVADRLLTFIGCCWSANHLTHLHPYLSFLSIMPPKRAISELNEGNVSTARKYTGSPWTLGKIYRIALDGSLGGE